VTSRLGTGKSLTFFLQCAWYFVKKVVLGESHPKRRKALNFSPHVFIACLNFFSLYFILHTLTHLLHIVSEDSGTEPWTVAEYALIVMAANHN
jgi:hypothetical protein